MKPSRLFSSFLLATLLAAVLLTAAHAADSNTSTIKFSDPSKPGTLKISVMHGDLRIQAADTNEISIRSDAQPVNQPRRKDGLRVLTAASSFSLSEKDNVATLDASEGFGHGNESNFRVTIPRNTSVVVQNSIGGDITCTGIGGDIEIHSLNGEVTLNDITGGAVVDTMNGEIHARIKELKDGKSLSFTSMNAEVVLRVPADAKANVRLRTQNGAVLTDFDESALVTKTENAPRMTRRGRNSVLPPEAAEAIREAARVATQAAREAAEAVKEGAAAARAEADRLRQEARDRSGVTSPTPLTPPTPATPPTPPTPPTITGGKLVTGTLNGGGPEINVASLNGDVTLRKL